MQIQKRFCSIEEAAEILNTDIAIVEKLEEHGYLSPYVAGDVVMYSIEDVNAIKEDLMSFKELICSHNNVTLEECHENNRA